MTADTDKAHKDATRAHDAPEVTIRMDKAEMAKEETPEAAERRRETIDDIQREKHRGRSPQMTRNTHTFSTLVDFVRDKILSIPRGKGEAEEDVLKSATTSVEVGQEVNLDQACVGHLPHELEVRYERLKEFAAGGQGTVATAVDNILHRTIALKSLRKEHLENEAVRRAFVNEALITAQLEHPAIISVYSLMGDDASGLHLAMQLVHGKTFHDVLNDDMERIERKRPSRWQYISQLHRRINTLIHVSEAIAFAHSKGIIHCDLKPENIMFGEYGSVFVMDWGIARRIGTQQEQLDGTPRYMPPEVFETLKREPSGDIYALGMILYEIVTFKAPFAGYSTREIIHKVRSGERCPIENSYGMPIPPALAAIIRKATAFKPSERYATVTDFISDLRLLLEDEPISALRETIVTRLVRLLKHYSRTFLFLMMAGWLIVLGISFHSLKKSYFVTQRDLTHARTLNTSLRSDRLHLQLVQELASVDNRMQKQAYTLASGFLVASTHLHDLADAVGGLVRNPPIPGDFMPVLSRALWADPKSEAHDGPPSPVYEAALNPRLCSYDAPPGADQKRVAEELARIRPVADSLQQLLFSSSGISVPEKSEKRDEILRIFMLQFGYPVHRVYLCLEDTGLCLAYPFDNDMTHGADARQTDWYTCARQHHLDGNRGSNQLRDFTYTENGMVMCVTCSVPIVGPDNTLVGVVAFELRPNRFRNILQGTSAGKFPRYTIDRYLMTREGAIASTEHIHDMPSTSKTAAPPVDERAALVTLQHNFLEILSGYTEATHREFTENGQNIYLHCAFVPGLDMYIVEKTSLTLMVASLTMPGGERLPAPSPSENEEESHYIQ